MKHQALIEAVNFTAGEDLTEEVQAYIDEAEHQDGVEYWDNFGTVMGAVQDFMLYSGRATD